MMTRCSFPKNGVHFDSIAFIDNEVHIEDGPSAHGWVRKKFLIPWKCYNEMPPGAVICPTDENEPCREWKPDPAGILTIPPSSVYPGDQK